jgi:ribonuclease R
MKLREQAGGLDFDTVEAKVRLDSEGYPIAIDLREKTDATQLIEEVMIMANEVVAQKLRDAKYPCMYRVHEQPDVDALEALVPVFAEFTWIKSIDEGLFVAGNPHELQKVLAKSASRPEGALVSTLLLRSMKRAVYSPQLSIHYGLASAAYAHFTSPIRRYPDLVVHRMLKALLLGRPEKFDQEVSSLPWIAEHSSENERVAERAARESQEAKIVELMEAHVGETFSALISGVGTIGLFVRLDNTAEGVVEMSDMGREYFALDPVRHMITGTETGKQFRLGRRIAVRLAQADRRTRQLRFQLV